MARTISDRQLRQLRWTANRQMRNKVVINRPDKPSFDSVTGMVTATTNATIYRGSARIWSVQGPQTMTLGDEIITFRMTNISIPYNAPLPRRDDIVTVYGADDPTLQGRSFRVLDVEVAGEAYAARRMSCTQIEGSATWPPAESVSQ